MCICKAQQANAKHNYADSALGNIPVTTVAALIRSASAQTSGDSISACGSRVELYNKSSPGIVLQGRRSYTQHFLLTAFAIVVGVFPYPRIYPEVTTEKAMSVSSQNDTKAN